MRHSDRAPRSIARYLIVDDRDGTVLAEHVSAEHALQSFGRYALDPDVRVRVSVVRLDHEPGRHGPGHVHVDDVTAVPLPPGEQSARDDRPSVP